MNEFLRFFRRPFVNQSYDQYFGAEKLRYINQIISKIGIEDESMSQ